MPYPFQPAAHEVAAYSEHQREPLLRRERRLGGIRDGHASGELFETGNTVKGDIWSHRSFSEPGVPGVPQGGPGAKGGGRGAVPGRHISDQERGRPGG